MDAYALPASPRRCHGRPACPLGQLIAFQMLARRSPVSQPHYSTGPQYAHQFQPNGSLRSTSEIFSTVILRPLRRTQLRVPASINGPREFDQQFISAAYRTDARFRSHCGASACNNCMQCESDRVSRDAPRLCRKSTAHTVVAAPFTRPREGEESLLDGMDLAVGTDVSSLRQAELALVLQTTHAPASARQYSLKTSPTGGILEHQSRKKKTAIKAPAKLAGAQ